MLAYLPVDVIVDAKAKERHRLDTLNLLAYVILLILVLVTIWFFKRRRRHYIHETGLAIIYGLLMGALIRYLGLNIHISSESTKDVLPGTYGPPDYVIVNMRNLGENRSATYAYEFRGELLSPSALGSQISYAYVHPEVFFNIILPPIVLNAGLSLKRKQFFRNIGAILSYAFIGTTISVVVVGMFIFGFINLVLKWMLNMDYLAQHFTMSNCLYFGAIISPTDPLAVLAIFQEMNVDVNLFALIFGESILNDAVSIVLTHSIDQFSIIYGHNPYYPIWRALLKAFYNFFQMFVGSCLLGCLFGVLTALTTKYTHLSDWPLLEISLLMLTSYTSFLTAEVLEMSGIVAILFCGITQAHYTFNNFSAQARESTMNIFELMTFLCENFLFLAVGVAFWQRGQEWDLTFIGVAFVAIIIARALAIYPLSALLNCGRRKKIPCNFQHMIAWGGGARGVISYSLAARNTIGDARRIILSTTSVIVIFSVIVVGGSADWMLNFLRIPYGKQRTLSSSSTSTSATKHHSSTCTCACDCKDKQNKLVIIKNKLEISDCKTVDAHKITDSNVCKSGSHSQSNAATDETLENFNGDCKCKCCHCHNCLCCNNCDGIGGGGGENSNVNVNLINEQENAYENANLVRLWRNIDNWYLKPFLTHASSTSFNSGSLSSHTETTCGVSASSSRTPIIVCDSQRN